MYLAKKIRKDFIDRINTFNSIKTSLLIGIPIRDSILHCIELSENETLAQELLSLSNEVAQGNTLSDLVNSENYQNPPKWLEILSFHESRGNIIKGFDALAKGADQPLYVRLCMNHIYGYSEIYSTIGNKIRPKVTLWKGNIWDLGDLIVLSAIIISLLPILPFEGRKKYKYVPFAGKVAAMAELAEFGSRSEELIQIYENEYKDDPILRCKILRDILLPMVATTQFGASHIHKTTSSNVPAIYLLDELFLTIPPIYNIFVNISMPDYTHFIKEVSAACQDHPGEFLDEKLLDQYLDFN